MLEILGLIWLISVISLFIIFIIINKSSKLEFVSDSGHIWFFLLFFPMINTVFLLFLIIDIIHTSLYKEKDTSTPLNKEVYPVYDGVIDDLNDLVAYVRLYDIKEGDESQSEILIEKFPEPPKKGYLFTIKSDTSIVYLQKGL